MVRGSGSRGGSSARGARTCGASPGSARASGWSCGAPASTPCAAMRSPGPSCSTSKGGTLHSARGPWSWPTSSSLRRLRSARGLSRAPALRRRRSGSRPAKSGWSGRAAPPARAQERPARRGPGTGEASTTGSAPPARRRRALLPTAPRQALSAMPPTARRRRPAWSPRRPCGAPGRSSWQALQAAGSGPARLLRPRALGRRLATPKPRTPGSSRGPGAEAAAAAGATRPPREGKAIVRLHLFTWSWRSAWLTAPSSAS
mmetsp:Transcript_18357/g.58365  ORF Transcript_18357/g.58365 Transcript_18357/m.58365 type:complete len:259 (-) Transcript_18357:272-1048(-)